MNSIFADDAAENDSNFVKDIVKWSIHGPETPTKDLIEVSEHDLFSKLTSNWSFKQRGRKWGAKRGRPTKSETIDDSVDESNHKAKNRGRKPKASKSINKIVMKLWDQDEPIILTSEPWKKNPKSKKQSNGK